MPVVTVLNTHAEFQLEAPRTNYQVVDWEAVREQMDIRIEGLDMWEEICNITEFNAHMDKLTWVVLEVIVA